MDWFSAIFAFEEWPMWPLAVDAASNWGERQRFRSRSSHLIPTLYSGTRSRPPQTSAYVCLVKVSLEVQELDYLWQNSSPDRFSDILDISSRFLIDSIQLQWRSRNVVKFRKWGKRDQVAGPFLDRWQFVFAIKTEEDLKKEGESMWGSLSFGVVLHMVGSSVSIQCYDCNKKDRFREMVRAIYRYWWWCFKIDQL